MHNASRKNLDCVLSARYPAEEVEYARHIQEGGEQTCSAHRQRGHGPSNEPYDVHMQRIARLEWLRNRTRSHVRIIARKCVMFETLSQRSSQPNSVRVQEPKSSMVDASKPLPCICRVCVSQAMDLDPLDELLDLFTYTCPFSGQKRTAGVLEKGPSKVAKFLVSRAMQPL